MKRSHVVVVSRVVGDSDDMPARGSNPTLPEVNPYPEIISGDDWLALWLREAQGESLQSIRKIVGWKNREVARQAIIRADKARRNIENDQVEGKP